MADDQFLGDFGPRAPVVYPDNPQAPRDRDPGFNPYDTMVQGTDDGDVSLGERFLLNAQKSAYSGTVAGVGTNTLLTDKIGARGLSPEQTQDAVRMLNARHDATQQYDAMKSWNGPLEGLVALAGQVTGGLTSPESLVTRIPGLSRLFEPIAGSFAGRVAEAGATQGVVNTATDPIIQAGNIHSGFQKDFDWAQLAEAFPLGFATGGAIHGFAEGAGALFRNARNWFGKPEPGNRVDVHDVDPQGDAGPLHGQTGTVVAPAEQGYVVKLDDGTEAVLPPEKLQAPDVPRIAEPANVPEGKPRPATKDQSAASAETVEAERIQSEIEAPQRTLTPDEIRAKIETEAAVDAKREVQKAVAAEASGSDVQFRKRVAGGAEGASSVSANAGGGDAVTSLHQQSMALAEALGMPLRQGRVGGGKDALGQFDLKQGVARTKKIADAETVFHESGHYIEKTVPQVGKLIKQHKAELGPMDYDANRADPSEGFAEYTRLFLSNPAAAKRLAPGFDAAFRPLIDKHAPDVMAALDAAQKAHAAYTQAPSDAKLDAIVKHQDHDGLLSRLKKDGLGNTVTSVLGNVYRAIIDDKAAVTWAVRDLARQARDASGTRLNLEGSKNPEAQVRLFARAHQSAVRDMLDGVRGYHKITPEGPSLRDAIITATGQKGRLGFWNQEAIKGFSDYLVARRAEVLWRKFDAGELPNRPLALSKGDVQSAIAKADKENPGFRAGGTMVHEFTRQMLRKQFEGGLIERELFDRLMKEDFYVPLYRDMSDKPISAGGPVGAKKSEGPGKSDLIKGIKGSDRDIIDPLQSIMTQTFLVNRTLAHNDIIKSFVGLAGRAQKAGATGTGRIVERIPAHQVVPERFNLAEAVKNAAKASGTDPMDTEVLLGSIADVFGDDPIMAPIFRREATSPRGEPILFYKDGGKLKAARFISEEEGMGLYDALAALPTQARDVAVKLGSFAATVKRAGIVTNPVFALTNWFRDQLAATILRPNYIPFDPRGLVRELWQGQTAQLYAWAGGVSPGAGGAGLSEMVKGDIDALARKNWFVQKIGGLSDLFRHGDIIAGAKAIGEAVEVSEAGTRLNVMKAVFDQKRRQGLNDYDAAIEAAYQATDLMDFGRHGSMTMTMRALIPFINAHAVSLDKAARTLITPLVRGMRGDLVTAGEVAEFKNAGLAWFKVAGVGGALGYLYGLTMSKNEAYQDANDQLRATHFIIPGAVIGQPGKIVVVPKPFELAIGFNLGEMLGQHIGTGDPRTAGFALDGLSEVLSPPSVLTDIPVVSTYAELSLNKSFFTGRDIVPERLQRLDASQQFNEHTSAFAKALGNALGVSPIKIDYAVGSSFGLWGRDLLAASNTADPSAPDPALEDTMFLRRFIKNADISSETTKHFWAVAGSQNGEYVSAKNTYENYLNQFQDEQASAYLAALPAEKRAFVTLNSAADEDGKPAFKADTKRLQPLTRAAAAVQAINTYIRDLSTDTQRSVSSGDRMDMDPTTRRALIDNMRILAAMEQRNALVMLKEPGYAGRPLLSPDDQFDVIMNISPAAGSELATRYAGAKIYKTDVVAKAWPEAEQRLVEDGSQADLSDLTADAVTAGPAFDGDKEKKAPKRRVAIPGSMAAP